MPLPALKLRQAPLWPALAALLVGSTLVWLLLPRVLERGAARQLLNTTRMLAPMVAEHVGPDLQTWAQHLPAGSDLRITVVELDGKVMADSARGPAGVAAMDNHRGRPEIREALASGEGFSVRRSDTTGREYVYAARTISAPGQREMILRLAEPLDHLGVLRSRLSAVILLSAVAAVAAMAAVTWWLDRRLYRPLVRIVEGADHLASGRYEHRLSVPDDAQLATLVRSLNRLAAGVEEQIEAVRAERDHLRSILARMSEGVLVVGADGRALLTNPAFSRLFGLRGDVSGRLPLEIARQPQLARIVEVTLEQGRGKTAEIRLPSPDERTVFLASASLGTGAGAVLVARDTTALTRLTQVRRDFVANVSHELKTPLAAIRGFAETLRDGALEDRETAGRFTERILVQCRRLQALLEDLLTLSRLETVDTSPGREPVELAVLIQRAMEVVSAAAQERGVEIHMERATVPYFEGDADSLERLLVNLLDNAVKYNRPGGRVSVRLARQEGDLVLEVADTGIGIPAGALPRIFERFYRVDKGRSRAEGGTGLGLAIVKHTAQLHGGSVDVESTEGQGSTFRVRLPLPQASDAGERDDHPLPTSQPA